MKKVRSPATSQRVGKFEQCSGGTLFLDEVGDMSPLMQSKVLRVLQDQQFERVGGTQSIRTDVRIITATNRDLEEMVEKTLRKDLYYRLNGFTIKIPPLRNRKQDILLLLEWFLGRFRKEWAKSPWLFAGHTRNFAQLCLAGKRAAAAKRAETSHRASHGSCFVGRLLAGENCKTAKQQLRNRKKQGDEGCDLSALIDSRLRAGSRNLLRRGAGSNGAYTNRYGGIYKTHRATNRKQLKYLESRAAACAIKSSIRNLDRSHESSCKIRFGRGNRRSLALQFVKH